MPAPDPPASVEVGAAARGVEPSPGVPEGDALGSTVLEGAGEAAVEADGEELPVGAAADVVARGVEPALLPLPVGLGLAVGFEGAGVGFGLGFVVGVDLGVEVFAGGALPGAAPDPNDQPSTDPGFGS